MEMMLAKTLSAANRLWFLGLAIFFQQCIVSAAPAQAQFLAQPVIFNSLRLHDGFVPDPQKLRGISGGTVLSREKLAVRESPTGACVGYIDHYADHLLTLETFFDYLKLTVKSQGDTVLIVRGPGGVWCNDDSQDHNPVIAGEWQMGNYELWVGSHGQKTFHPYVLEITQGK